MIISLYVFFTLLYKGSGPLVQVCSTVADVPPLVTVGSGEPVCQAELSPAINPAPSPFPPLGDSQATSNSVKSDDCAEYTSGKHNHLNCQNAIAFVNIDSYEPDSSDGEDEVGQADLSLVRGGIFQETLDSMLCELEKGVESFTNLQSHFTNFNCNASGKSFEDLRSVPFKRLSSAELDTSYQTKTLIQTSSDEESVVKNNLGTICDMELQKNTSDSTIRAPVEFCNELSTDNGKMDQGNSSELVVRPKVRKQNPLSQLDRKQSLTNEEKENSSTRRWSENVDIQQRNAECVLKHSREKVNSSMFFDPRDYEGAQNQTESELKKQNITLQDNKSKVDDSAFWEEFEDFGRNLSSSYKDEDR